MAGFAAQLVWKHQRIDGAPVDLFVSPGDVNSKTQIRIGGYHAAPNKRLERTRQ
jgi:hypothetical protein